MKSYGKITFGFLILSLIIFSSCKENTIEPEEFGSISGTVLSSETNQPVQGASVTTSPASNAVVTGVDGKFSFANLPTGTYTVNVSKTDFQKSAVSINVPANSTAQATVLLEKKTSTNSAPFAPSDPTPNDASENQPLTVKLSWKAGDPDKGDSLKFDIYLYRSNMSNSELIAENIKDTTFTYDKLQYNTTYFWQVVAKDTAGEFTNSKVWSFTTEKMPHLSLLFASNRDGNFEIYATDSTASRIIRLTNRTARDWKPIYSPDRSKIAFTSDETNEPQIYVMNSDGNNVRKITTIPVISNYNNGTGFAWSPDGSYLIYCNYDKLYRINSDGTNLTLIATAPQGRQFKDVSWSELNKIAVLTVGSNPFDNEIYLVDSNGANFNLFVGNSKGTISSPHFSPDGNKIIFSHDQSGNEVQSGRQLDADIIIMNLTKSDSVNISNNKINGTNDLNARFTSTGANIVFENQVNDNSKAKEVWIMNVNGNNRRKVLDNAQMPDWR